LDGFLTFDSINLDLTDYYFEFLEANCRVRERGHTLATRRFVTSWL